MPALLLRAIAVLLLLTLSSVAVAAEVLGSLKTGSSPLYAKFNYALFGFDAEPDKRVVVALKSGSFDAYLMLVAPDGRVQVNDDHSLQGIAGLRKADAGLAIERPASGRWWMVVTSLRAEAQGDYVLEHSGLTALEQIAPTLENRKHVSAAFTARRVEDPLVRRDALFEQLTLASYRDDLQRRLKAEVPRLDKSNSELRQKLAALDERKQRLVESAGELQHLSRSRELLLALVAKEQKSLESEIGMSDQLLLRSVSERTAYAQASAELEQLASVAQQLQRREDELLASDTPARAAELAQEIRRLRAVRETLGKSIADKLLDSRLVRDRQFSAHIETTAQASASGAIGDRLSQLLSRQGSFAHSQIVELGGSATRRSSDDPERPAIDPRVWLPALLPWPPPTPSAQVVLDRRVLNHRKPGLTTLGQLDDTLQQALTAAGYSANSYWGVPHGFALITPLEQTDASGRPLAASVRWASKIAEMKTFSLSEYLKALFTAPSGHFRVLVFVASSQPFSPSGAREMLQTIQRWSSGGLNVLPDAMRAEAFTDRHHVTVLVYEFLKLKDSDLPSNVVPGRLQAPDHLKATNLALLPQ